MEPKYSVLLCNKALEEYREKIDEWLKVGIKVIWFGNAEDVADLKRSYPDHAQAFILQAYEISVSDETEIIDGDDTESFVGNVLETECPLFNSAQYMVEHCNSSDHIIVQASAGTGKTTVMIDRIMFLLHTQEDLHLPDIYMVTFTNDATNQMNKRLQDALVTRYDLTRDKKYLRWLEEQSQMNVSTIHSFAYQMLREYGIGESFTKNLAIRGFQYEKSEIVKNAVDKRIDESRPILGQLGVPFYRAKSIVNQFWGRFLQLGISHEDILSLDWGEPINKTSQAFHKIVTETIPQLDEEYFDIKRKNDGVGLDDIMRDLQEVLKSDYLPKPDISMKYLFIDEFQDSDLSQIMVACLLVKLLGAILFVVGDVKQSIYRFRGANDQSFDILHQYVREMKIKEPVSFELVNNYRTSSEVLKKMDRYFEAWGRDDLLQYEKSVIPFNQSNGLCKMLFADEKSDGFEDRIAMIASVRLDDLKNRVEASGKEPNEKTRVVILTRTNWEAQKSARILRKNKIPVSVREDGSFYASEAVRDFFIMVSSFMFPDEPKYIFDFLLTPYAGEVDPMNINDMEMLHGDYDNLVGYLDHFLDQTNWKKYHKEMRLKPILSVFKEILDDVSVIDNYIMNKKAVLKEQGWEDERCNAQTYTDARQYQANLEKLMEVIQRNMGGEKVSIYDIYNFLKINVATNRSENEAEVQAVDDYTSVLCMTVHKAKGLEFDTIFIPFTNRTFITFETTEVIIDPITRKASWKYTGDKEKKGKRVKYDEMASSYYDDMKIEDSQAVVEEETRILYVAMTRAINHFMCLVPNPKNENTWANLISEVGVDYE